MNTRSLTRHIANRVSAPAVVAMDRSTLFHVAWREARSTARNIGGTARSHFAMALKRAWTWVRRAPKATARPAAVTTTTKAPALSAGLHAAADRAVARRRADSAGNRHLYVY